MRIVRTGCVYALGLLVVSCGGAAGNKSKDASSDTPAGDSATDKPIDGGAGDAGQDSPGNDGGGTLGQPLGTSCLLATECESGFCADGVCCNNACTGVCMACALQGSLGTCMPAYLGSDPRNECDDMGATSCGTNGACDGTGACQKYPSGVICAPQACTGSTLKSGARCDGDGTCVAPTNQTCAPFICGSDSKCLVICANDGDCVAPNSCINGSCGKKPIGATCGNAAECNSGMCEQGVCCGTTCTGTCRSCALPDSAGTCTAVPDGQDPLGQCADAMAPTCGTDGFCDGKGACRQYATGTTCIAPSCAGSVATLAGRCDGGGVCTAGVQQPCEPYVCGTNGQCLTSCSTNADCNGANVCTGGACSKRPTGMDCSGDAECLSGACNQGVCCNVPCEGTCMSCAVTGARGTCTPVPVGQDPLAQCPDMGQSSCGTDGVCNGVGGCRFYPTGSACGNQTCSGSTVTLAARCDGVGSCVPGANQSCTPYACGATSCLTTCATGADCSGGNVCAGNSCGKLPLGASCTAGSDCASTICAQGACCQTACTGLCMSCALTGTAGTCSTVPAGSDPLSQCADQGAATCGTDGMCDGAGGCRLYASGTTCVANSCSQASYTPPQTCNGTGTCQGSTAVPCDPYQCGTNGTCRASCSADGDCVAPNVCIMGQCAKKTPGTACTTGVECASGQCQQGVCCSSSCTGTCRSCALAGSLGTCTPALAGTDPLNQCTDSGAPSCGTDGTCDGAGTCRLYAAGTMCATETCTGVTHTPARSCNGTGSCLAATPNTCDPYVCGTGGTCRMTCGGDGDCNAPNTCLTGSCGKKPIGATCGAAGECNSGFCEQGVCCGTACTGTCRSCALAATPGTCSAVPAGQDPLNQCTDNGAAGCGQDGTCNGSGACRLYATGTTCVASSCTGSTLTPARTCNGAGTCQTVTNTSCGAYTCGTGGTCRTTCATNADCVSPNVCLGTSCGTGLVAYYKFDETTGTTAADSSGNGRNATLAVAGTGTATFSATHMVGTDSVNLGGTSNANGGYVTIPASLNTMGATTTITIACWVNITTDRAWGRIFDFNNSTTTGYMFLTTFQSMTTPNSVRFAITTTNNAAEQQISSTARLSTGAWHHIAVVLDAGATYTGTLYIDGAVAGTNTAMTIRPSNIGNTPNNWIGRSAFVADPYFSGLVDDFRIYNRALTAAEIANLFSTVR